MRKAIGITLALLLILGCLGLAKGLVYAVEVPIQMGNAVWYNAHAFVMTPFGPLSPRPSWMGLLLSVIVVALLLRWAFGREHTPTPRTSTGETPRSDDVEREVLARDLDRVARRMEERIDALETILLDRRQTP